MSDDFTRMEAKLKNVLKPQDRRRRMGYVVLTAERFIRQESPSKSGHMRRTAHSRVERGGDRGVAGVDTPYARAVHFGYKPFTIRPKRKPYKKDGRTVYPALFWKGARHPVRLVKHPGYKGNPFVTRARQRLQPTIAEVYGKHMFTRVR